MTERVIRTGLLGAVLAAALVAASCGSAGTPKPPTAHGIAGAQATVRRCAGARRPVGSRDAAWAGILLRPTIARIAPDGAPLARFGLANANGYSTVFSIVGEQLDTRCR